MGLLVSDKDRVRLQKMLRWFERSKPAEQLRRRRGGGGGSSGNSNYNNNYYLYKYDTSARRIKRFDNIVMGSSLLLGITTDAAGNIYLACLRYDTNGVVHIHKYNSAGGYIWGQPISHVRNLSAYAVEVDSSGNVIAGYPRHSHYGANYTVTKFDSAGVEQWRFDAGSIGYGLATDAADNIYIAAGTGNNVVKLNAAGVEQWNFPTGGTAYDVDVDAAGNVYVGGTRAVYGGGLASIWKLNAAGVDQWGYDTTNNIIGIALDAAGTYVHGVSDVAARTSLAPQLWQITSAAVFSWSKNFAEMGVDVKVDSAGNVYASCPSGNVTQYNNLWSLIHKFSAAGTHDSDFQIVPGTQRIAGGRSIHIDADDNIYFQWSDQW